MKKVLMVCLGNICRSPLAQGILHSKVDKNSVIVDSAGTGEWHVGELPDQRSIQVAKTHNINITTQRCRQFQVSDFDNFDMIYVMDNSNYSNVISMARNESDKLKVYLILDEIFPNQKAEVPDPYYDGERGFENVFQMLDKACDIIANKLKE